jgi:hypothetical protein
MGEEVMDEIKKQVIELYRKKDDLLKSVLPEGFNISDLRCVILPNKIETYTYCNVPILEVHPLEFEPPDYSDDKIVMRVNQKFRKLQK